MATRREVTCITKGDIAGRENIITHIGNSFVWGKETTKDAIRQIENGIYSYYVNVKGNHSNVIVASRNGIKYLKTEADTTEVDNLLQLPRCA